MNPLHTPAPAPAPAPAAAVAALVAQARWVSPLGPMTLAASEAGVAGVWFDAQKHHPGPLALPEDPGQRWIAETLAQLQAYFDRRLDRFDLPLDLRGTPFQQQVWRALLGIERGRTATYGEIARHCGRTAAVRAVGAAVGRNPVSIVVPCHRVLGLGGALTGYAGGLPRKQALLTLEGAWPAALALH